MLLSKYKKKLEKRFKNDKVGRKQLNFACDAGLIARLKLLAKVLDTPLYPLAEHIMELGMSEVAVMTQDTALTEILQRHLLEEHLLVGQLNPIERHVSDRAKRISNTLKLLELIESKAGSPEAVGQIIEILRTESELVEL
ncbi:hypothetical protein ACFLW8_03830 [Chloroflexota bacterium]